MISIKDLQSYIKLAILIYSLLLLIALTFGITISFMKTGLTPQGVATHFLGDSSQLIYKKSFQELAEQSFYYLAALTPNFFLLSIILSMSSFSNNGLLTTILSWSVGVSCFIVSPWLIVLVSSYFSILYLFALFLIVTSITFMIIQTITEVVS